MTGSMRQRSPGSWSISVSTGRDAVTGKYRQQSKTVRGTKTYAKAQLAELVAEVAKGQHTGASATFAELVEKWSEAAFAELSPSTVAGYEQWLRNRILPGLGHMRLSKLRAADLDAFYGALRADLAPATVRQIHAIVHRALEAGVDWDWLPSNPASRTRPKKVPRYEITPPSPEDVLRLLRAADATGADLGTFVRLSAATGARRGEVTALRWRDVDFDRAELRIAHAVIYRKGLPPLVKDTKTHAERRISLDATTVDVLRHWRKRWAEVFTTLDLGPLPAGAFLFSPKEDASQPWAPDHFSQAFAKLRAGLGLRDVRLHDLRHAHASELIGAGIDVIATSKRLGHSSPALTMNVYGHALRANDQRASAMIGELLTERDARPDPPVEV